MKKRALALAIPFLFVLAFIIFLTTVPNKPNEAVRKDSVTKSTFINENEFILQIENWTLTGPDPHYFSVDKSLDEVLNLIRCMDEVTDVVPFPGTSEQYDRYLLILGEDEDKEYLGLYPYEGMKLKKQNTFILSDLSIFLSTDSQGYPKKILFPSMLLQVEDLYLFSLIPGKDYKFICSPPKNEPFMDFLVQFYAQTKLYDVVKSNEHHMIISLDKTILGKCPLSEAEKNEIYTGKFSITLDKNENTMVIDLL